MRLSSLSESVLIVACLFASRVASAQVATPDAPTGAPPPEGKAVVTATVAPIDAPNLGKAERTTNITLSAGGQWLSGNSNSLAGTVNGVVDVRRGYNGFGASLLGNYAQGATPGNSVVETAGNVQARLRYDRYLGERESVFLMATARNDVFQGLQFRLNIDPGFKYIFLKSPKSSLWGEVGYDFQYDIRYDDALVQLDGSGNPIPNAPPLDKTQADHSVRLFAGYRHAFNDKVTLSTGLEYLQSFIESTRYRMNFDARLAAAVGGGFSIGMGVGVRYDHDPLPGKKDTDTSTTISLIYAFSNLPKPPTCPCPPPLPPPPPPPPVPSVPPPEPSAAPSPPAPESTPPPPALPPPSSNAAPPAPMQ